jgi:putative MATE family efflux protein
MENEPIIEQPRERHSSLSLGEDKINRLLIKLSFPAAIGMISMALYNLVDTIFVGRGVGTLAIGALSIIMPLQMLIFALTQTLGIGGASLISRALGEKDTHKADLAFGNLIVLTILLSISIMLAGYLFPETVLYFFGAKGEIVPYALDYFFIMLLGTPFLNYAMVFNTIIRAEGNAKTAMITMIIAALINIILDPVFIFILEMGVRGAAVASIIAQFISFSYIAAYFTRGNSSLHFHIKNLNLNKSITKEIFAIGVSPLGRHGAGSIVAALLNHILFSYGGALSVAVYGIINRILRVSFMPLMGLVQGFLPIAGYNYGAKKFKRLLDLLKISSIWAITTTNIIWLILMIFARDIIAIFSSDISLINQGEHALRIIILIIPLLGFQLIGASYFQALGKALPSFILSLSRQIFFFFPLVFILPRFWGLNGVWLTFPLSDILSVILTGILFIPAIRRLRKEQAVKQ